MNDLSPDMQNEVQTGTVTFREALKIARLNLPQEQEISLAREAREGGADSFKKTLSRITAEQEKRGAPPGLLIVRISFGQKSRDYNKLKSLAKKEGVELSDYCMNVLKEHSKSQTG